MEDIKIAIVTFENICNIFSQLRSGIQLIQNRFKLIKFGDSLRIQTRKPVEYKDIVAGIGNILVVEENNCLLFKNNIKYT